MRRLIGSNPRYSGTDDGFSSWDEAIFWNEFQARGWRKAVAGNGSASALELGLTQAEGTRSELDCSKNAATLLLARTWNCRPICWCA